MKKKSGHAAALAALMALASTGAYANDVYVFDTVTSFVSRQVPNGQTMLSGVLRSSNLPITLEFRQPLSYCRPLILMMLEKPGRYYLTIGRDTLSGPALAMTECGLELRN